MPDVNDKQTKILLEDLEQKQQTIARLQRHLDNCVTTLRDQVSDNGSTREGRFTMGTFDLAR